MRELAFGAAIAAAVFIGVPSAGATKLVAETRSAKPVDVHSVMQTYGSVPGTSKSHMAHVERHPAHVRGHVMTGAKTAHWAVKTYGSVPGGVVVEGIAQGLSAVTSAMLDPASGELALETASGRVTYQTRLSARAVVELARAIAEDDRVGVSVTDEDVIAYGGLELDTTITRDLTLSDVFLADFVVPPRVWTAGYETADGFSPDAGSCSESHAVFFRFDGFDFSTADARLSLKSARVGVVVVPVLDTRAEDGGYVADLTRLEGEGVDLGCVANAQHVANNIGYYSEEQAADRALAVGELAALLRRMKADGVDLSALAGTVAPGVDETGTAWESVEQAWADYVAAVRSSGQANRWRTPVPPGTESSASSVPAAAPAATN